MRIEDAVSQEELRALSTGECYHDCFNKLMSCGFSGKEAVLVHGRPTLTGGPHEGKEYGHAWLEYDMPLPVGNCSIHVCEDVSSGTIVPAALFYMFGKIDPAKNKTYTFEQANELALITGHSGPWE